MLRLLFLVLLLSPAASAREPASGCPDLYEALIAARPPEARTETLAAAEALEACPRATPFDRAQARLRAARTHRLLGDLAAAETLLDALRADGLYEALPVDDRADYHLDRFRTYYAQHQWTRAIPHVLEAIRLGEHRPLQWRVQRHTVLAQLYNLGRLPELAEAAALEAMRLATEDGDAVEQARAAAVLTEQQLIRWSQHPTPNPAEAEAMLATLDHHDRAVATGDDIHATLIRFLLLDVRVRVLDRLNRHDEALAAARRIMAIAEATPSRRDFWVASRIHHAMVLRSLGRLPEARAAIEDARSAIAGVPGVSVQLYEMLGSVAYAEGDLDEARVHLETARDLYAAGQLQLAPSAWTTVQLDPSFRLQQLLVALHLDAGRPAEALATLDNVRAGSVRDLRRLRALGGLDAPTQERLAAAQERLDGVHRQMLSGETDAATFRRALVHASAELVTPVLGREAAAFDLPALQQRLAHDGRVVVAYYLGDASLRDLSVAFVIRSDTLAAIPLTARVDELTALRDRLPRPRAGTTWLSVPPEPLQELYALLFAPVAHLVPEGRPVTFVPSGPLVDVPFGLLLAGPAAPRQYRDWPYLLRRHPISIDLAPSLIGTRPTRTPTHSLVAFGRSEFEAPAPQLAHRLRSAGDVLPHLPAVRTELAALRRRVPRGTFAVDASATRSNLLDLAAEARVIHLASHVLVSPQPFYSSILLAPDDPADPRSGALYFFDLLDRDVAADLVVLSGCDSALGATHLGEGMLGLHFAFRAAGAGATLATLWPIDDDAAASLMDRFYQGLGRGLPSDVALQQAQLAFLDGGAFEANPLVWGGFTLSGTPTPIDLGGGARWALWLLALGLAGAALGGLLLFRRRQIHA